MRILPFFCLLFGLPTLLNSCSPADTESTTAAGQQLLAQDFDQLDGWFNVHAGADPSALLSTTTAHSGRYAARVGGSAEYGISFSQPLGQQLRRRPAALELSYWCYTFEPGWQAATVVLVLERAATKQRLLWHATDLSKFKPAPNKWTRVSERIAVPDSVDFSDVLVVYPWRGSAGSEVLFDDLQVRALKQ